MTFPDFLMIQSKLMLRWNWSVKRSAIRFGFEKQVGYFWAEFISFVTSFVFAAVVIEAVKLLVFLVTTRNFLSDFQLR